MKHISLALLVVILSAVTYVVAATQFGIYQKVPWIHLLLMAAALVYAVRELTRKVSIGRILVFLPSLLLTLAFSWWTLSYSAYGPADEIAAGTDMAATFAQLETRDQNGNPFSGSALAQGKPHLIIFYRGHW